MAKAIEVSAHFDGERIVVDEPLNVPAGTPLKIVVSETDDVRREAMLRFIGSGNYADRPGGKYIDDRSTYYDGRD